MEKKWFEMEVLCCWHIKISELILPISTFLKITESLLPLVYDYGACLNFLTYALPRFRVEVATENEMEKNGPS